MSKFEMEFYIATTGVALFLSWRNEREFRMGQAFLQELADGPVYTKKLYPDQPDIYYLETEQQYEALMNFRQRLRDGNS